LKAPHSPASRCHSPPTATGHPPKSARPSARDHAGRRQQQPTRAGVVPARARSRSSPGGCLANGQCGSQGRAELAPAHRSRAGRNWLEPTVAGRVWTQLCELGFMDSSLQFAALFTLGFIPFLIVLSVALGPGLTHAMVMGSGFNARAGHDVTMLFSHSRTAPA